MLTDIWGKDCMKNSHFPDEIEHEIYRPDSWMGFDGGSVLAGGEDTV